MNRWDKTIAVIAVAWLVGILCWLGMSHKRRSKELGVGQPAVSHNRNLDDFQTSQRRDKELILAAAKAAYSAALLGVPYEQYVAKLSASVDEVQARHLAEETGGAKRP